MPSNGAEQAPFACDGLGCIARFGDNTLSVVRDGRALLEDCDRVDVVVSLVAVPQGACEGPNLVIDRWDLWHGGSHALRLSGSQIVVETVSDERGARPWTARGRQAAQ